MMSILKTSVATIALAVAAAAVLAYKTSPPAGAPVQAVAATPAAPPAAAPAAPSPARLAAAGGPVVLRAGEGGHFVSPIEINGRRVTMLVDTGASLVALSHEDARALGVQPQFGQTMRANTANGVVTMQRAVLSEVRLDNIIVRDVQAAIAPPGAMQGSLLGMSFLSRLRSFQARAGELILTP
jgi:aspartyl protease family protein